MIRAFIALSLISASAAGIAAGLAPAKSAALNTAAPWWEKVTVTVPPGGEAPKCTFTSSNGGNEACDVESRFRSGAVPRRVLVFRCDD